MHGNKCCGRALKKRTELVTHRLYLVDDLQTELDNARFKGAGDAATTAGRAAQRATQATGGQVEVGVIEGVVQLGAELNLETLQRRVEVLVQRKVRGVIRRRSARVAALSPNGLSRAPLALLVAGKVSAA